MREQVLFTPRAVLESVAGSGLFQGFTPHYQAYVEAIFRPGFTGFLDRELIETVPALKQLIPYLVLSDEHGRVICYERGSKSGEKRLAGRKSVGLGGHVSLQDGGPLDIELTDMFQHARRELHEELTDLHLSGPLNIRGFINDDSDDVGKVHLGLVIHGNVVGLPKSNEAGKIVGVQALTTSELLASYDGLENWSKLVVANLPFIQ